MLANHYDNNELVDMLLVYGKKTSVNQMTSTMDKYKFTSKKDSYNMKDKFFTKSRTSDKVEKSRNNSNKSFAFKNKFDKSKPVKSDSFFVQKSTAKPSRNSEDENSFFIEKNSSEDKTSRSGHSFGKSPRTDKDMSIEESYGNRKQHKNKLHNIKGGKEDKPNKKPFDKKRWRLQKYSKKYKLEQWEEKRKKIVLREYYKQIKDDKPKLDVKKIYEEYENESDEDTKKSNYHKLMSNEFDEEGIEYSEVNETPEKPIAPEVKHEKPIKKFKKSAHKRAQMELERLKQEKQAKREEIQKQKDERKEALKLYKKKKVEKYKKLNQKTKKGQPIMKGRIEMLLEKIQST